MTPATYVLILLALALLASTARLAWRLRTRAVTPGRFALRVLGQAAVAALLWFALFPPPVAVPTAALVVVTPGANDLPARDPAGHWVALPGAPSRPGITPVPDLATALRTHPGSASLRVLGHGLPMRDRDAAAGWPMVFEAAALPQGLVALDAPDRALQGQTFTVRGRLQGLTGATVELLDPAGDTMASVAPDAGGAFEMTGLARIAGPSSFRLRWQDADGETAGEHDIPVDVLAPATPRLLVLAGGPSPELKYLRRWAVDAGLALHTVIEVGGGVQVGDPPLPINTATLAAFDLVVLDERAWRQLGAGGRARLREAVRGGLGVLVRITGPLDRADVASLRDWGLLFEDFDGARSLAWPGTAGDAGTISSPDDRASGPASNPTNPAPVLSRRPLRLSASHGRALVSAPDGEAVVAWRNEGRGRIGASILSDSYRLWLSGRIAAHGELWASTVQTLARAHGDASLPAAPEAWLGERVALCGVSPDDTVTSPEGDVVPLVPDPASGTAACAGYWPARAGAHRWQHGGDALPLMVRDPAEHPALAAAERQAATHALAAQAATVVATPQERPGPRWPWWLAWLLASVATWWLERRVTRPPEP